MLRQACQNINHSHLCPRVRSVSQCGRRRRILTASEQLHMPSGRRQTAQCPSVDVLRCGPIEAKISSIHVSLRSRISSSDCLDLALHRICVVNDVVAHLLTRSGWLKRTLESDQIVRVNQCSRRHDLPILVVIDPDKHVFQLNIAHAW